jgi:hypothetical protein
MGRHTGQATGARQFTKTAIALKTRSVSATNVTILCRSFPLHTLLTRLPVGLDQVLPGALDRRF